MTRSQEALLLTVGRILRAKVQNEIYVERDNDLWALNDALSPFDPTPAQNNSVDGLKAGKFSGDAQGI